MSAYTVHAKRWARGWELHIEDTDGTEVGVTQSRSMGGAERMVREYLALDLDADPDSFDVAIDPELDSETEAKVASARNKVHEAERVQAAAAEESRSVVQLLKSQGLRGIDIAKVLGVSPQRVSQLTK